MEGLALARTVQGRSVARGTPAPRPPTSGAGSPGRGLLPALVVRLAAGRALPWASAFAVLGVSYSAHAQGVSPLEATAAQKDSAQRKFQEGLQLLKKGRPAEAQKAFEESFGIVASPNSYLMVGRALREQKELVQAYETLERVEALSQKLAGSGDAAASKYAETAKMAAEDKKELRAQLGMLNLKLAGAFAEATVRVGSRELSGEDLKRPVAVVPGPVRLEATTASGETTSRDVSVAAGQELEVELGAPAPVAPAPPPKRVDHAVEHPPAARKSKSKVGDAAVAAFGVGALGAGIGVAGLVMASETAKERDACQASPDCVASGAIDFHTQHHKAESAMGIVGLAVGGAALVTGGVLLAVHLASSDGSETPRAVAPKRVRAARWHTLTLDLSVQSARLRGTF